MIEQIAQRLDDARDDLGLELVSDAVSFAVAFESTPLAMPAAYVVLLEDVAGRNETGGGAITQRVRVSAGVIFALSNVADAKGVAASRDLRTYRDAVLIKLFGWVPVAGCDPLESGRGHLLAMKNGVLWWQDIYTSAFTRRYLP